MTKADMAGGFGWRRLGRVAGVFALAAGAWPAPALALGAGPAVSQPVVQSLPTRESLQLSAALARLGRDPRDIDALIDAGHAALAMGDVDAAIGFFRRADQVSPSDARVKVGLAGAMTHSGDPVAAIPLFEAAEKAGSQGGMIAGDRGLAYDLVGDNATAQYYYRQALALRPDDEITRRLALSLAISGDRQVSEAALLPLLRKQDKAAWRARVFTLAILGQTDEAIRVAQSILPESLAGNMAPYLRYMQRLTPAQQAAAANLGNFPRASEIGRDDPRIVQYAGQAGKRTTVAGLGAGLVPKGEPLGASASSKASKRKGSSKDGKQQDVPAQRQPKLAARVASELTASAAERIAPPEPLPSREGETDDAGVLKPVATVAEAPKALPAPIPAPAEPAAKPAAPITAPGFDLANVAREKAPEGAGKTETGPAESERRVSLAEVFSDLGKPEINAAPATGAVDIRKIKPAQPVPEPKPEKAAAKPAKPAPPSHASRIWVQMEVGRDKAALAFDWRKFTRESAAVFRGRKPYVSGWGPTNRMLVGPFESEKAAKDFLAELRKAGMDGPHVWISPAGQVVDALPVR